MSKALEPGVTLQKRYKILSQIGTGGMGSVYKVMGIMFKKELALKELYDDYIEPEEKEIIASQFKNEAKTLARLNHPGIPHIYDAFEDQGKYYIVMELVRGVTLDQVLRENPQYFLEHEIINWFEQVLEILTYLHNRPDPVIVRDIKPTNIMLTPEGTIRLIDFGIAKIFDPRSGTKTTMKGSGSERFAPPEQYGTAGTDVRSDIYSLGVSFYYILTKQVIPNSIDRMLHPEKLQTPSFYNPLISPAHDAMILKMMELKPENRFQNVEEIQHYMRSSGLSLQQKNPAGEVSTAKGQGNAAHSEKSSPPSRTEAGAPGSGAKNNQCRKCGAQLKKEDNFCYKCGQKQN